MNIDKYFNLDDYKLYNPDLQFSTDEEYLEHWNSIGKNELRIFNKSLLDLDCEFGFESMFYIPYYNYLISKNLLHPSLEIKTHIGMEPFYCFLKDKVKITFEKQKRIPEGFVYFIFDNFQYLHNNKILLLNDYKTYYSKYNIIQSKKPLLILANKFTDYNYKINFFFSSKVITSIVELLKDKYQIIYMQSPPFKVSEDYTKDGGEELNTIIQSEEQYFFSEKGLNEFKEKHKEIILYTDIFPENGYNDYQLKLFSMCDNYICHPGGLNGIIMLYFAKKILAWVDYSIICCKNNSLYCENVEYYSSEQMHDVDTFVNASKKLFLE